MISRFLKKNIFLWFGHWISAARQIGTAIQELNAVVQQNASAEELSSQANWLQQTVAFFKVKGDGRLALPRDESAGHPSEAAGDRSLRER